MKYVSLIFLACFISKFSYSQDSLNFESEINFDIRGQHILTHFTDKPIDCIDCPRNSIQDNPFNHFAIYSGVGYKGTLNDKYTFDLGLVMEERSFSGGNTTLDNLQFIPRITISVNDSIRVGERHLVFNGKGGDFWNEDFDDILRIYNLDFNAMKLRLGLGKFQLGFDVIGDLSKSIGLDFHELYKFSGTYNGKRVRNVFSLEVNELFDAPRGSHLDNRDYNISNYIGYGLSESVTMKMQASLRINSLGNSLAIGAKMNHKIPNLDLAIGIKYYLAAFNDGYGYGNVEFTDGDSYVGEQLYPLKNYYRNVNQWALLTQYRGSDIFNFEAVAKWQNKLYKKIYFLSELDLNVISRADQDPDYYPMYNTGFKINFEKNFEFAITVTNKHMNLGTYYQSLVAGELPFLSYRFRMNLDKIKLKTKYLKG